MAEEEENKQETGEESADGENAPLKASAYDAYEKDDDDGEEGNKQPKTIQQYFEHGVRLLTLPGSSLVINDDTRRLLALFSDGRFLVSESHKFDGRVLSFEVLARKKKLSMSKPIYVSQNELNAIYSYGERNQPVS